MVVTYCLFFYDNLHSSNKKSYFINCVPTQSTMVLSKKYFDAVERLIELPLIQGSPNPGVLSENAHRFISDYLLSSSSELSYPKSFVDGNQLV